MHRFKVILAICIFIYSFVFIFPLSAGAISGNASVNTQARIGKFTINISGFIAPFATVVLSSDTISMATVVADNAGNFSFSGILIKAGFSHFCLDATDAKKFGTSEGCLSFPPASGNLTFTNIFLPPTLGLVNAQIPLGSSAFARGYSMPGAQVTLHSGDGRVFTTIADSTGYFEFHPVYNSAGEFQLFADATLGKVASLEPQKKVTLTVQSLPQQVANQVEQVGKNLSNLLKILGPLLLAIPILILIIILLKKLWPSLFPFIPRIPAGTLPTFFDLFKKRERKLHHWWMKGVGF